MDAFSLFQAGSSVFNRAKLLNVGFLEALKDYNWDCFVFHDVDLIPENDHNLYACERQPKHLVVGRNVTGYRCVSMVVSMLLVSSKYSYCHGKNSDWHCLVLYSTSSLLLWTHCLHFGYMSIMTH